ncbi:hypothetical protein HAX54_006754 [Datura stramonium]|uniref:Uncharacterized protein n=1 Tax=Datura stramonium TaxID=4076 RepID=A0ABS8TBX9_DATST|nr:hypothetical protein [Datura stramonium]
MERGEVRWKEEREEKRGESPAAGSFVFTGCGRWTVEKKRGKAEGDMGSAEVQYFSVGRWPERRGEQEKDEVGGKCCLRLKEFLRKKMREPGGRGEGAATFFGEGGKK